MRPPLLLAQLFPAQVDRALAGIAVDALVLQRMRRVGREEGHGVAEDLEGAESAKVEAERELMALEQAMQKDGHLQWMVIYKPGTLEATGYKSGKKIITDKVQTTGEPEVATPPTQ